MFLRGWALKWTVPGTRKPRLRRITEAILLDPTRSPGLALRPRRHLLTRRGVSEVTAMTNLMLQPTGDPDDYEVTADGQNCWTHRAAGRGVVVGDR